MSRYRHAGAKQDRRYISYSFLTTELDGVSGRRHALAALHPREKDSKYPLDRRLSGPRTGLDTEVRENILFLCRKSKPGRPVCSQALY
jgi:hypothetical protein